MKKLLLSAAAAAFLFTGLNAQETTITSHFAGGLAAGQVTVYNWQNQQGQNLGFISGTNTYGDKAVVQKFDASFGVLSSTTVTSVKALIPVKADNGGSIKLVVWSDNAGVPGAILAEETITLASIDTTAAGLQQIMSGGQLAGAYNVSVTFPSAVALTGSAFWAGVVLPTGAGNAAAVMTTSLPAAGQSWTFALAATHAGVIESDDSFLSYPDALDDLNISNAIFPTVVGAGANLEQISPLKITAFPNPASDVLNISIEGEEVVSVSVLSVDGKVVSTSNGSVAQVAELTAGVYFYEARTASGAVVRNSFVKN